MSIIKLNQDFSTMSGYEFEDYIAQLFRAMGFRVTQTDYSGDGGIDMLMFYDKPVFKGKYVVQCKNYTGLVGQPEVRDLYGVVMSESANKGMLITTSDFTEQAYAFADGKNLELINRQILNQLIAEQEKTITITQNESDTHTFLKCAHFNSKRYNYIKKKIEDQPSESKYYFEMIDFLRQYFVNGEVEICQSGLFEELISNIHLLRDRCFKAKSKDWGKRLCYSLEAEIRLAIGDLAEAIKLLLELDKPIKSFYLKCSNIGIALNYGQHKEKYAVNTEIYHPELYEGRISMMKNDGAAALKYNLYSAFCQLNYNRGKLSMLRSIRNYSSVEEYKDGEYSRYSTQILSYSELFEVYQAFIYGEYDDKFYCIKQSFFKDKTIERSIDGIQASTFLRNNYYKKSDEEIITELDEVFDTFEL